MLGSSEILIFAQKHPQEVAVVQVRFERAASPKRVRAMVGIHPAGIAGSIGK